MRLLRSEEGFTFVEVMITMAIVSLAFVTILGTNLMLQKNSDITYEHVLAVQDANQVIERIRDGANSSENNFQEMAVAAGEAALDDVGSLPDNVEQEITIEYVDESADPLDVTVSVSWSEQGLRPVSESVRALITYRNQAGT